MQNKEEVYFLTVKQAIAFAEDHQEDENWELWKDYVARAAGNYNKTFIYKAHEATQRESVKAS